MSQPKGGRSVPKDEPISAATFAECLRLLGWSYAKAAEELGVHSRQRVADFARGRRKVPLYLQKSLAHRVDQALRRVGI